MDVECHHSLLSLSQTINFRCFQTKRVCRQQSQISWIWHKVLQIGRKHCGKWRNCLSQAISPFPTVFSKDLYCRHVKTRACLGKGYLELFIILNYHIMTTFCTSEEKPVEIIMRKEENAGNQHFPSSHNVFYSRKDKFNFLRKILFVVCKCFQDGKS